MLQSRQNIHIAARIKPPTSTHLIPLQIDSNLITISQTNTQKQFLFDQIFQDSVTQQFIDESIGFGLVQRVVEGFHATIICYGQTGSGKTFTIYGEPTNYGIVPRAAKHLLDIKDSDNMRFILRVGCVEIYNDQVRDLLDECRRKHIKEAKEGVYVKDMVKRLIKTYDDFREILNIVDTMRSTFETCMNAESSRSHCILTFYLEIAEEAQGEQIYKEGRLHCVDLAGSERQKKAGSVGLRLKQANSINKNLVVLRNVIHALIQNKDHVPYRDCKLTRLLKDSFGGSTKTKLIANVSYDLYNLDETISTLRYAAVVSKITNCPKIHYDAKDLLIKQYIEEIKKLKEQQLTFYKPQNMEHSKLIQQKQHIAEALEHQQHQNQELKNRIDALTKLINPSSQLPPLEKKKFNQYRKRKLEQLSQKESILQKSKQLIRNAEIQFQAEFSNNNENMLDNQYDIIDTLDVEKLRQKYKLLKARYINLKDQMKSTENDFQQERELYNSKIRSLENDNIFYRDALERYVSPEQLIQMKTSTVGSQRESLVPILFKEGRQVSSFKRGSSANSESSLFRKKFFQTGESHPNIIEKTPQNQQYFALQREQLFHTQTSSKKSKSKSLSRKQRFKPLKSPRALKASTQPTSTFHAISPKPKELESKVRFVGFHT